MTITDLKQLIDELPDDMRIVVDLDLPRGNPHDGCTTSSVTAEAFNNLLYITAKYPDDNGKN